MIMEILFKISCTVLYTHNLNLVLLLCYLNIDVYIYVKFCGHNGFNQHFHDHMITSEIKKWVN